MYIEKDNHKLNIFILTNFFQRFKGFMFKKNIDYALCFPKCNSIHTFFMKEKIDVFMADKDNKVIFIYKNLKKNKIILPKKHVYYTYELPINTLDYELNDYIKIKD